MNDQKKLRESLLGLIQVGDEIYEQVARGGWDFDYHPQTIEKIEGNTLYLYESSINERTTITRDKLRILSLEDNSLYYF